uniref:Uncharacterized protein n=1 Tax=Neogobius melanostomus TaxID=47308 RepID=A0A8C6WFW8_9GOBI
MVDMVDDALDIANKFGGFFSKVSPTRQCSVQICNGSSKFILRDPKLCADPLTLTIKPDSSGKGLFIKSQVAPRGSGGVFTYDLYNADKKKCEGRMAVLYKVPYDLNLRSIVFAIGIMEMETECDKHLFHNMYKKDPKKKPSEFERGKAGGSSLKFESGSGVTIRASMSNSGKAKMNIEVKKMNI